MENEARLKKISFLRKITKAQKKGIEFLHKECMDLKAKINAKNFQV